MASITLSAVWLYLASNPSAPIVAGSMGSMGSSATSGSPSALMRIDTQTTLGSVRQYADGTFRSVTTPGVAEAYQCTMRELTLAQTQTIESWLNQVCLIRDRLGRRIWGTISALAVGDYPNSQLHDVSFVFTGVSYSEAV